MKTLYYKLAWQVGLIGAAFVIDWKAATAAFLVVTAHNIERHS